MNEFTLQQLRKELKTLGFKVKIKTYSFGKSLIFTDNDGNESPTIFTKETLEKWSKLVEYKEKNKVAIKKIRKELYNS